MAILENAIDAVDGAGYITIRTSTIDGELLVRFEDSGRGMSEEKLERLFDMSLSANGARVGAGLGLAQAYNIVQRHRGTISATSRLGRGTVITLRLPTETCNETAQRETVIAQT